MEVNKYPKKSTLTQHIKSNISHLWNFIGADYSMNPHWFLGIFRNSATVFYDFSMFFLSIDLLYIYICMPVLLSRDFLHVFYEYPVTQFNIPRGNFYETSPLPLRTRVNKWKLWLNWLLFVCLWVEVSHYKINFHTDNELISSYSCDTD